MATSSRFEEAMTTPAEPMTVAAEDGRPPFPLGGPTSASWREQALSRIAELRFLRDWMLKSAGYDEATRDSIALSIGEHLTAAAQAAKGGSIFKPRQFR